jgi:hypothetical protein
MAIFYGKEPKEKVNIIGSLYKWNDYYGNTLDIWHDSEVRIYENYETYKYGYDNTIVVPDELKKCLDIIRKYLWDKKDQFQFKYYARDTRIEFIYKDEVYRITPNTFGFRFDLEDFYCLGDAHFEAERNEIMKILKETLGIEHTRYLGYLD